MIFSCENPNPKKRGENDVFSGWNLSAENHS